MPGLYCLPFSLGSTLTFINDQTTVFTETGILSNVLELCENDWNVLKSLMSPSDCDMTSST